MMAVRGQIDHITKQFNDITEKIHRSIRSIGLATDTMKHFLIDRKLCTDEEYGKKFEELSDKVQGIRSRDKGEEMAKYDNIFCEIWWEEEKDGKKITKDFRRYFEKAIVLGLTRQEGQNEFEEINTLVGKEFTPDKIYDVIRKMPEDYKQNPAVAGKELNYKVRIHKCKPYLHIEQAVKAEKEKAEREKIEAAAVASAIETTQGCIETTVAEVKTEE